MKKYFSFLILTLCVCLLFIKSVFAYVDVNEDNSPPFPNDNNLLVGDNYIIGTSNNYNDNWQGCFIASNQAPAFYGSFYTIDSSRPRLHVCAFYQIGANGNWHDTTLELQGFSATSFAYTSNIWTSSSAWGRVFNKDYNWFSSNVYTYNNGINYYYADFSCDLSSQLDSNSYTWFNDSVEILSVDWYNLSNSQIFQKCVNFSHPTIMGVYDNSVPTFISADLHANKVSISDSMCDTLSLSGQLNNVLSDGNTFDSETYVIDSLASLEFGLWQFGGSWQSGDAFSKCIKTYNFNYSIFNLSNLNLDLFNGSFRNTVNNDIPSFSGSDKYLTPNNLVLNFRLRRKSDGNFGDWFVLDMSDLGYGNRSTGYTTSANSGIVTGASNFQNASSQIDSELTENSNIKVSFDFNGTSLGTSYGKRLYEGGGYNSSVDIGRITTNFGQVPQMFSVVFSFLPPFVLEFIAMAFVTTVAVAIVKAIL